MRRGELYRVLKIPGDPKKYRIFVIVSRQALIDIAVFNGGLCPCAHGGSGAFNPGRPLVWKLA